MVRGRITSIREKVKKKKVKAKAVEERIEETITPVGFVPLNVAVEPVTTSTDAVVVPETPIAEEVKVEPEVKICITGLCKEPALDDPAGKGHCHFHARELRYI